MKLRNGLLLSLACSALVTACDVNSNVEFKGDRASSSIPPIAKELAQTNGGSFRRTTSSGYKTDLSIGGPINIVQRKTASGLTVQFNIIGQASN